MENKENKEDKEDKENKEDSNEQDIVIDFKIQNLIEKYKQQKVEEY